MLPHLEFRAFVQQLKDDGDLVEINEEVDPYVEVGAIIRKVHETNDKAPLFNNVKGNINGVWRILGAPGSLRPNKNELYGRIARHVGLPVTATMSDIMKLMRKGGQNDPLPPRIVPREQAPCKQNLLKAGEFDLDTLPSPWLHPDDGGKFLQTYGMHVVQTPDGTWTNYGISRASVCGSNKLSVLRLPGQDLDTIIKQWEALGKDVPWALCQGAAPALILASGQSIPDGVSETSYVGAIYGEPLDVVKCETSGLLVPASSEIVFEGTLSITHKDQDGPFGEQPGYIMLNDSKQSPTVTVSTITHRDNPILPVCCPGRPTDETHTICGGLVAAVLMQACVEANMPVLDIHCLFETQGLWLAVSIDTAALASRKTNSAELRKTLGELLFNVHMSFVVHRVFLVGPDIDIFNFNEVMFAFATRCEPSVQETVYPGDQFRSFGLIPFVGHGYGEKGKGCKAVHDCLLPGEYEGVKDWVVASFQHAYPEDVKAKINHRWEKWRFVS